MSECKYYNVCPASGILIKCQNSGYDADCVRLIISEFEDYKQHFKKNTPNAARVAEALSPLSSLKNPAQQAIQKLARDFAAQASATHEPKRVKVRKHKRKKVKPEGKIEIGNDSISFYLDGDKLAFFKDGALTMSPPIPTNPVPTMERPK